MSRTYRRKSGDQSALDWQLKELIRVRPMHWEWVKIDPESNRGIKIKAKYYSDNHRDFKEPGPSWFRNFFVERPQRREAKRQLQKYLLNSEIEVILNSKDPLVYWT